MYVASGYLKVMHLTLNSGAHFVVLRGASFRTCVGGQRPSFLSLDGNPRRSEIQLPKLPEKYRGSPRYPSTVRLSQLQQSYPL